MEISSSIDVQELQAEANEIGVVLENIDLKNVPEGLMQKLDLFINRTYDLETYYKDLRNTYELLEIFPQAIWVFDDQKLTYKNPKAISIDDEFNSYILELFSQNKLSNGELEFRNRHFLIQTKEIASKIIVTATDITNEKRIERLASMGRISAHLAHEIRNPIGSLSLLASALKKRIPQSSELVVDMQRAIFRVERIIKATLLFSKGLNLNLNLFCVRDLAKNIDECLSLYNFSRKIDFKINLNFDQKINIDINLFEIVLQNFIYNAIDAVEDNCEEVVPLVSVRFDEVLGAFIISDNGYDVQNPSLLFEPFNTTKLNGNGLGLALSMQIVNAHNGHIALINHNSATTYEYQYIDAQNIISVKNGDFEFLDDGKKCAFLKFVDENKCSFSKSFFVFL